MPRDQIQRFVKIIVQNSRRSKGSDPQVAARVQRIPAIVPWMGPVYLRMTLEAVARLEVRDPAVLAALSDRLVEHAEAYPAEDLGALLRALAALGGGNAVPVILDRALALGSEVTILGLIADSLDEASRSYLKDSGVVGRLATAACERAGDLTLRSLEVVLNSLAKLRHSDARHVRPLVLRAGEQASLCDAKSISVLLNAVASLDRHSERAGVVADGLWSARGDAAPVAALAQAAAAHAHSFTAQGYAMVLGSLARLGHDDEAVVGAVSRAAVGAVGGLSPQGALKLLPACSMRHVNAGLAVALQAEMVRMAPSFTRLHVTAALGAFARLPQVSEDLQHALGERIIRGAPSLTPAQFPPLFQTVVRSHIANGRVGDELCRALCGAGARVAPALSAPGVVTSLTALTRLPYTSAPLETALLGAARARAGAFTTAQLASVLEAVALLQQAPDRALVHTLARAATTARARAAWAPYDICRALHALRRLGSEDRRFVDVLCASVVRRSEDFTVPESASALFALSRLQSSRRYDVPAVAALSGRLIASGHDRTPLRARTIANPLTALASLHHRDAGVVGHLAGQISAAADDFGPKTIAACLSALAKLNHPDAEAVEALAGMARARADAFSLPGVAIAMHGLACLGGGDRETFATLAARATVLLEEATGPISDACAQLLHAASLHLAVERGEWGVLLGVAPPPPRPSPWVISELHRQASAALTQMGIPHANEQSVRGLVVDIVLTDPPGGGGGSRKVAVEVDGAHHFHHDGTEVGTHVFKRRLLTAMGWTVVNITRDDVRRTGYLRSLLASPGEAESPRT